ncbi:MAG TPA: LPS export ABC transporter periplasmic protein LptC [Candidatus Aquilonibacter sp.]
MMRGIVAAIAIAALVACNPKVQSTASSTPSPAPSSTELALKINGHGTASRPVRFVQQTGNRREYDLLARSFESVGAQGSARVTFDDVSVTFHAKNGATLYAAAPKADLDQVANTITMNGGVKAHNDAGMTLQCDQLLYDHSTQEIYGTGHVVITNKSGFRATAGRFKSDISLTHTRMQ